MSHLLINGMALLMSLMFPQNVLRIQSTSHSACNPSLAFIQAENNSNTGTNVITQAFDSPNTQGCLIVSGSEGHGITVDDVTPYDSNGNGSQIAPRNPSYTKFSNGFGSGFGATDVTLGYAANIKTGANSVSSQAIGSALTAAMQEVFAEFSGATSQDQEADSTCTSCSNPIVTPSITIGQTEMVVSFIYDSTNKNWTAPAGWTVCATCFNTTTTSSYMAYRVLTAGTYSISWTSTTTASTGASYFIASFK